MNFTVGSAVIELNNRELAVTFWLGVLLLWALWRTDMRSSLAGVVGAASHPVIAIPVGVIASYSVLLAWIGTRLPISLWHGGLIKETLLWFVGSALVLLLNINDVGREAGYLRGRLRGLIAWTAIVTFVVNLEPLPLLAELVLQPILAALAMMLVISESDVKYRAVQTLLRALLTAIGLALFIHSVRQIVERWEETNAPDLIREMLLPVWMTAGLVPLIFVLAVLFAYEALVRLVRFHATDRWAGPRAVVALLSKGVVQPRELAEFRGFWLRRLAEASTVRAARAVVVELRQTRLNERRVQAAREERLRTFAGVDGANELGVRLDQREFGETVSALRFLGTSQMGWYRHEDRYREEPFAFFRERLARDGLTGGQDVRHALAGDGQSWWGSRRTVSGWVFAIGANGSPPDQWFFDGPDHPTGFPGQTSGWRECWESEAMS